MSDERPEMRLIEGEKRPSLPWSDPQSDPLADMADYFAAVEAADRRRRIRSIPLPSP